MTVEAVGELLAVRRLLVTPDQVEEHVGERARRDPTEKTREAGWPWPWTVQAEAVPPEVRDRIVAEAIDALHDIEVRQAVIDREPDLHEAAREALAALARDADLVEEIEDS